MGQTIIYKSDDSWQLLKFSWKIFRLMFAFVNFDKNHKQISTRPILAAKNIPKKIHSKWKTLRTTYKLIDTVMKQDGCQQSNLVRHSIEYWINHFPSFQHDSPTYLQQIDALSHVNDQQCFGDNFDWKIQRLRMIPTNKSFKFNRLKFLVWFASAVTINKVQK